MIRLLLALLRDVNGELYVADQKSGIVLQIVQPSTPRRRVVGHL